ncbi:poly(R)-hydroxyalkanoic acid synthase, class I [Ancylobacter novellus DSM 506]|uniref:Poly(R)-hydroxyalkanoic acid synthase, class I n=2 Tax=Ancylobacter novellus TaxID=921 RepID=D7A8W7_ANCN5|nr:poly(R)-hydroxyalkanoic acid synthase, class I [Ancylobacter novellus DSM 506]
MATYERTYPRGQAVSNRRMSRKPVSPPKSEPMEAAAPRKVAPSRAGAAKATQAKATSAKTTAASATAVRSAPAKPAAAKPSAAKPAGTKSAAAAPPPARKAVAKAAPAPAARSSAKEIDKPTNKIEKVPARKPVTPAPAAAKPAAEKPTAPKILALKAASVAAEPVSANPAPPAKARRTTAKPTPAPAPVAPPAAKAAAKPAPKPALKPAARPAAKRPVKVATKPAAPAPAAAPAAPSPVAAPEVPRSGPIDLEAFAGNLARMMEEGGKAMAAYLRPREDGRIKDDVAEDIADVMKTIGNVAEYWLADPQRTVDAQSRLIGGYLSLWSSTLRRLSGKKARPVAEPTTRDGRFVDPEWSSNPFFDALKQAYLLTANWAEEMVEDAEIDAHTKHKAEFYVRQIASAVSPSNFVLTNPELLRTTLASNGENLVRGMKMLAEDIEAGGGDLKIRQTDASKFRVGENLASTPGKVVFQNELMQLIQYAPQTESVLATPVVIVPPWINKFYVLDLSPEKSFIRWAVKQGLTVFVVSWVNPGPELATKGFDAYMRDGVLKAFEVAKKASGAKEVHAVGYCVGGTMLAMTLAWLAASGKKAGVRSASFLTTQVDFTYAGDLKVFIDEEQVANLERKMLEAGVMQGRHMANAFNMLRSNDLIWPYVVNNYLKGQAPFPFDILYWNSDSTRLPAANHSFYLRNCYLDNRLAKGVLMLAGKLLDLKTIDLPVYSVATREDHIAPAPSVFLGVQLFGNPGRFVLAGSGHIAGVINPPERGKYQYWTGDAPTGKLEDWIARAEMHPGSWWPDWFSWIEELDGRRVPADTRIPGEGAYPALEDAPGSYVKVKS